MPTEPSLWTRSNPKIMKGRKRGYHAVILHLAPAGQAGIMRGGRTVTVCPDSTPQCRAVCLHTAGMGGLFSSVPAARIARTRALFADRKSFLIRLCEDLQREQRYARRQGLTLVARPNGTSDLPFLGHHLAEWFPTVQFYDYTKIPAPWLRTRPNYHLTFSHSESNVWDSAQALTHGVNVAAVFGVGRAKDLPSHWGPTPVVDGDRDDLRFLDPSGPSGVIVGLRAKGRARGMAAPGGFVVPTFGRQEGAVS